MERLADEPPAIKMQIVTIRCDTTEFLMSYRLVPDGVSFFPIVDTLTVDELLRRIEAEVASIDGGAIAFDGDGTLWSGDVGEDFFHGVLERAAIRQPAIGPLKREAREGGVSDEGSAVEVARRIYDAYVARRFDEERVCEIMTWICAGFSRAELSALCTDLIESQRLAERLHQEVQAVVAWAKKRGVTTYLVSASPAGIVEAAALVARLPVENVVAARPVFDGDEMTAAVLRPIPYGPGKVARLRERLGQARLYAAFGDNAFDVPMLREAKVAVAVRPKARLTERAHEVPGLVQIARRD
jgi:HAD superfamily phosphoserine phosphatase-like hydrolase